MTDPMFIAAAIGGCVIASELLVRHTPLRHLGTALLVILVTAVVSNAGIIPTDGSVVYDGVFAYIAPMAIFWLLLRVDLRHVLKAGVPMLGLFLLGAAGTALGAWLAMTLLGADAFGDNTAALGGMFTATYIGGSANFNALALHYEVTKAGPIYAGAMAVDAGLTAVWMAATIVLPKVLARFSKRLPSSAAASSKATGGLDPTTADRETLVPLELAAMVTLGLAATWLSKLAAAALADRGWDLPSILILTSFALVLAQLRPVQRMRGASLLGMFSVYVFLAVIGALCDVGALAGLGSLGLKVGVLAVTCVGVHALLTFGGALVLRLDPAMAAVASQANIGGGTTALALARSLGREDLVLPGILVGSVGTALGTFVGFAVAGML